MATYLQILNIIKDTALAQPNVNSVVREFLDLNREDAKYSAIVIQDRDGSRDRIEEQGSITYTWHLGYVDRLTYDESNRDDIISTGINIINNIVNTIRNTWFPELEVSIVDRINTFNQRFTAQCAGVYVVLAVNVQVSDCVDSESTDLYDTYDAKITANGVYHFVPSGRPVDEINITVDVAGPKKEEVSLTDTVTMNGIHTYIPEEDTVYKDVELTVDVHPTERLVETYTTNGVKTITGEFNGGVITVDVPAPQFVTETLNVSTNGTYTPGEGVDGYSMVTVDVAGTDIQKDITEGIDYSYTTLNNNARFVASYRFYDRFINYKGSAIYLYSFTSINLPACSILYDYAFYHNNLSNISLPVCSYIGNYAFNGCNNLSNISLPVCSYIGNRAFNGCNNLSNISLPVCERIESYAFEECYNLSNISLPVCSYIGEGAFDRCNNLSNISLPVCERIESYAFQYCNNLSNISLPVCSYIGETAFQGCNNLSNISLPVCSYIGNGAFNRCELLSNISLPVCSYIGETAFQGCNNLSNISLPVCSYIGFAAFEYCNNLSNISLPVCSYIGGGAFNGCELLSNISLPVCERIEYEAFMRCNNLSNISLPVCSYIGNGAFNYCYSLSKLTLLYSSVVTIEDNIGWNFGITPNTGSIFVPASLVDAYKSAPIWSKYSNRIFAIPS